MPNYPDDRTARIGGKRWRVRFLPAAVFSRGCDGDCSIRSNTIRIKRNLKGRSMLESLIHETLHAAHWQIAEECVAETADDLARLLWRLGYRRENE